MKVYIGIDPGKNGGIAALYVNDDGQSRMETWKIPATERDLWEIICDFAPPIYEPFAYVEKVASSPQMGVKSAFTFGDGNGLLRGMLIAAAVPFERISPGAWQRGMKCLSGGDKNITKAKAQELFPAIKVTHAIADAMLIAEYCHRERTW